MDQENQRDPLMEKADALMRRHRAFVAQPRQSEDSLTQAIEQPAINTQEVPPPNDDDLPVLTEIIDGPDSLNPQPNTTSMELQRWLDEELPAAVLSVLDGLADHLVATLTERIRSDVINASDTTKPGKA